MRKAPLLALSTDDLLGVRGRIYRTCLDAILAGVLRPGERIASARRLAQDWGVARNTVDDALAQLQSEGWLVRRVGDGTRVATTLPLGQSRAVAAPQVPRPPGTFSRDAITARSRWGRRVERRHDPAAVPRPAAFMAGMPDVDAFPLDAWRRLASRRLRASGAALLGYPPALGLATLRAAVARHLGATRGLTCTPEQVMICNSAMQAIELVARVVLEPRDAVWIEDPGYPNLRALLAAAGARIVDVPIDAQGLDVEAGLARRSRPAMMVVTPACHYPMGVEMSLPRRLALLRAAEAMGSWIVEDDDQAEFAQLGAPVAPIARLDPTSRTIVVGTFSHVLFPSLRIAWCVLPPALVPVLEAVRRQLDDHTHGPWQAVLADFIDEGLLAAHVRRMRALYAARRAALADACARRLDAPLPARLAGGLAVALPLPAALRDRAVVRRAAAEGVDALPLSRYATAVRVNGLLLGYAALDERAIVAGVTRLARALR